MLSRFPIDVFDAPSGLEPRWPTFGIKLGAAPGPITEVHGTASMSRAMLNAMSGFGDRRHVDDAAVAARTIVVDTGTVRATDFDLDRDAQDLLFRNGREAALNFLDGAPGQPAWDWEAYKRTYRSASRWHQRYHVSNQQDQTGPDTRDAGAGFCGKRHCRHARRTGEHDRQDRQCRPPRRQSAPQRQ